MAAIGKTEERNYTERVIRTIKEDEILNKFPDLTAAKLQLQRFINDVHQAKQIHCLRGYLTPSEFAAQ